MTTPRAHCLDTAKALVTGDRQDTYGDPATNASTFMQLLASIHGDGFGEVDYPIIMILTKLARLAQNPDHLDSWVDIAGYAALGYELAGDQA